MKTHTLQIRDFPYGVNKALKLKAVGEGISFRALVVRILTQAANNKGE